MECDKLGKAKTLAMARSVAAAPANGQSFLQKLKGATDGLDKKFGIGGKG
jgi:hypothetical protein